MKCSTVRNMLMAYVSAELPPGEERDIREHLADCVACRAELDRARRASDALVLLAVEEAAPAMLGPVRERLIREKFGRRPALRLRLAAVSALLVGVLVAAGLFWQKSAVHENAPMARQPSSIQTPIESDQAASSAVTPPVAEAPEPMAKRKTHKPIAHRPTGTRHPAGPGPPVRRPPEAESVPDEPIVVKEPVESPAPEAIPEAETDSESVILFALRPADPETYVIQVSDEGESLATELTVVREFDIGGNVTSVTIEHTVSSTLESDSGTPIPESGQLMEVSPAREFYAENLDSGGYIHYA